MILFLIILVLYAIPVVCAYHCVRKTVDGLPNDDDYGDYIISLFFIFVPLVNIVVCMVELWEMVMKDRRVIPIFISDAIGTFLGYGPRRNK